MPHLRSLDLHPDMPKIEIIGSHNPKHLQKLPLNYKMVYS